MKNTRDAMLEASTVPLIFCHYGNSKYLEYVLEAARLMNPDKTIFLLGDMDNKWLGEAFNITHLLFEDYDYGNELKLFEKNFRLIKGDDYFVKGDDTLHWVNFVFKRWFYVYNFIVSKKIKNFWHFDSDNMILTPLSAHESKFQDFDCTEQCNGICMNGYISGPIIVHGYINKINELFLDKDDLGKRQKWVKSQSAFTEMAAYVLFKESTKFKSIRLNSVIDNSVFDDCICQDLEMEFEKKTLLFGRAIKKIYCSKDGKFYCRQVEGAYLRLNTLNLSWVPIELFEIILVKLKMDERSENYDDHEISKMPTLHKIYNRYILKRLPQFIFMKLIRKVKRGFSKKLNG